MGKFHPNCVTAERLINLTKEWRIPDGSAVVMMPGRITRSKGHLFLIDALAKLKRDDLFCVFMGKNKKNSSYRQELEDHIEANGMSGKVRMVENCTDMPAAYMLSTVVVCASIEPEGFGRIPIEAQAMGRPAISTEHGGAMETIIKDETGWLVPPHDVSALAKALDEAMSLDNEHRAVLGTRAMSHIARYFSLETMCQGTLDVYAELLGVTTKSVAQSQNEMQTAEAVMQASG